MFFVTLSNIRFCRTFLVIKPVYYLPLLSFFLSRSLLAQLRLSLHSLTSISGKVPHMALKPLLRWTQASFAHATQTEPTCERKCVVAFFSTQSVKFINDDSREFLLLENEIKIIAEIEQKCAKIELAHMYALYIQFFISIKIIIPSGRIK